ncbi:MAG: alkaline phosphatase family protein [Alphaproteobacteria bacterium]|nr:alkaline phosphatase family protein [Alphaproteobacteria bacterium]
MRRRALIAIALSSVILAAGSPVEAADKPHNVILFVSDGLRARMVDAQTAPHMAAIRDQGVGFSNSHSLFPTFTTANASGMATGHYLGDTGDFSNTIYVGFPVQHAGGSVTPFLENDTVIDEVDDHLMGNYLNEETVLAAASGRGLSTAIVGKVGPVLIFNPAKKARMQTIVIDDATGNKDAAGNPVGVPVQPEVAQAIAAAGLPAAAPSRGANGNPGNSTTPGTKAANVEQQAYFADVATKVILPMFKARNKPFVLVFWSRDPDGSQHNQGDSFDMLTPGINGPTSLAAIKNADDNLGQLQAALTTLGLADSTDIIVTADHGFSTISKESKTSPAARAHYGDILPDHLPVGFVALDIAQALGMPLFDPDNKNVQIAAEAHPKNGNGLIGKDPAHPDVVVAANGGSDLVYLPKKDKVLAARVVKALMAQDYVSGLFVDDSLGRIPGTLPLSAINMHGAARTPTPAIAVNFRTWDTGCGEPTRCGVEIADTGLQQGQGMHGSFSRADTFNFMAAAGPDFKRGFVDPAPVSNADLGKTIARLMHLSVPNKGKLVGRVVNEALPDGAVPKFDHKSVASLPGLDGLKTVLNYQTVGRTLYFDAAGFPGRTLGLTAPGSVAMAK